MERKDYFATCQGGFEELLKTELFNLGIEQVKIAQGGVHFSCDQKNVYKVLLHTRLASRILMPLKNAKIFTDSDLYSAVFSIDWNNIFDPRNNFFVHFNGTNEVIRNSNYGAMRVKDAVVDYFERNGKARPSVDKDNPDVRIHIYLNKDDCVISYDLSGEALNIRGYRKDTGAAPLRETLAASILVRSDWEKDEVLLDPMCGCGTILIEAAMLARNIPPQINRFHWGFDYYLGHNVKLWNEVLDEARSQILPSNETKNFIGFDLDRSVIAKAKANARAAGVSDDIHFDCRDVKNLKNPFQDKKGAIITNPPYGERLGATPALIALYGLLGEKLKEHFAGFKVSIISSEDDLLNCVRMRSHRQFKVRNGQLDCILKNYRLGENSHLQVNRENEERIAAPDFGNRLAKNIKKLTAWAEKEGIDCYRLYDADLPEYNLAVDKYQDYLVVQEYKAPKNIDPKKARGRLLDAISTALKIIGIASDKLVLKTREKQKGTSQYQKLSHKGEYFDVNEYGVKFWVNLTDYLDTGLFLDHRLTRKMIGQKAKDKRFLNLFAYTGSASVHAALGGALATTTIDMSNTYLNWAENNFDLNDINMCGHKFIQADCLKWLSETREKFDLIFIDPPTFSNSKRMEQTFDVERDQLVLFKNLKRILSENGEIIFSNNKRNFKMDLEGLGSLGLTAQNISKQTLPLDFARNVHIHNCWIIKEV